MRRAHRRRRAGERGRRECVRCRGCPAGAAQPTLLWVSAGCRGVGSKSIGGAGTGRVERAVDVWGELIERHGRERSTKVSRLVVAALYGKACDLEQTGRDHESLAAVAELLDRSRGSGLRRLRSLIIRRL